MTTLADTIVRVAQVGFFTMLVVAFAGKLDGWSVWHDTATGLPRPNWIGAEVYAYLVPASEVIVAGLVFAKPVAGLAACAGLLVVFTVVVWVITRRDNTLACNCFGTVSRGTITRRLALRDASLAGVAFVCGGVARRHGALGVPGAAYAMGVVAALVLLISVEWRAAPRLNRPTEPRS
jgi:Methylamine utilisation protein MauE